MSVKGHWNYGHKKKDEGSKALSHCKKKKCVLALLPCLLTPKTGKLQVLNLSQQERLFIVELLVI
jgi:hypothetical protein